MLTVVLVGFSSVLPDKRWYGNWRLCYNCFLPHPFASLFTTMHPFDAVLSWVTGSVVKSTSNKQQKIIFLQHTYIACLWRFKFHVQMPILLRIALTNFSRCCTYFTPDLGNCLCTKFPIPPWRPLCCVIVCDEEELRLVCPSPLHNCLSYTDVYYYYAVLTGHAVPLSLSLSRAG